MVEFSRLTSQARHQRSVAPWPRPTQSMPHQYRCAPAAWQVGALRHRGEGGICDSFLLCRQANNTPTGNDQRSEERRPSAFGDMARLEDVHLEDKCYTSSGNTLEHDREHTLAALEHLNRRPAASATLFVLTLWKFMAIWLRPGTSTTHKPCRELLILQRTPQCGEFPASCCPR